MSWHLKTPRDPLSLIPEPWCRVMSWPAVICCLSRKVIAFDKFYSHQKHFLRSFFTRPLALGRKEEEGAVVVLVRVGAGTSYSPSKASITPCKRPSCCRKSCSTLYRRRINKKSTIWHLGWCQMTLNIGHLPHKEIGWGVVKKNTSRKRDCKKRDEEKVEWRVLKLWNADSTLNRGCTLFVLRAKKD